MAYEVLSNDSSRRQYDARRNRGFPTAGAPGTSGFWDADADGDDDGYEFGEHWIYFVFRRPQSPWDAEAIERERQRQEERERERARQREERERRESEAARKRDAKLAAKQAQQAENEKTWKATFKQETQKQQVRWQRAGALSKEAKLLTCLHSEFCAKVKQPKKFKCGACSARRGMIAFECPHCACHLCQLCVSKFTEKRAVDEKPKPPNPRLETPEPSYSQAETEPDSHSVPNSKPTTSSNKSKRAARSHQDSPVDTKPSAHGGKNQYRIAKGVQPNTGTKHEANPTAPTDQKQEEEETSEAGEKRRRDRKPGPHVNGPKPSDAKAPASKPGAAGPASMETMKENTGGLRHGLKEQTAGENPKQKCCFKCGKPDHLAAACPQSRDAQKDVTPKLCYTCGKPGHVAAVCRQSRH